LGTSIKNLAENLLKNRIEVPVFVIGTGQQIYFAMIFKRNYSMTKKYILKHKNG